LFFFAFSSSISASASDDDSFCSDGIDNRGVSHGAFNGVFLVATYLLWAYFFIFIFLSLFFFSFFFEYLLLRWEMDGVSVYVFHLF